MVKVTHIHVTLVNVLVVVSCVWLVNGQADWTPDINPTKWNKYGMEKINKMLDRRLNGKVAKNIIFFMGDGMGPTTVTAGRILKGQLMNRNGEEELTFMEKLDHLALSKTYNIDAQTPDSAGTGTALLTGVKTRIGAVGVNGYAYDCETSKGAELENLFDWARYAGKATGLVTTARLTDATPACAYSHIYDRHLESFDGVRYNKRIQDQGCKDIASQFVFDSQLDVTFAGGRRYMLATNETDYDERYNRTGMRVDGRNLIEEWMSERNERNITNKFVWKKSDFEKLKPDEHQQVLGLFAFEHMDYELDRVKKNISQPNITELTLKAIELLSTNKNGFFLFVEGAKIDKGHHDSLAKKALHEFVAFDNAVGAALARVSLDETLFVVTADHSHVFTLGGYANRGNPLFGIVHNKDEQLTRQNLTYTPLMYANGPGWRSVQRTWNLTKEETENDEYRQESVVPLKVESHGGEEVAIYASGPMSFLFDGTVEQNYVAHVLAYSACIGPYNATSYPDCLTRRGVLI